MSNASAIFKACVQAIQRGELIEREGRSDKEFHFQNWFKRRLETVGLNFDSPGRNSYPDFRLVRFAEGFELKGWPIRAGRRITTATRRSRAANITGGRFTTCSDAIR
ncbi:hypothetical protein [Leptothermofonsia sp. ETS-13]|uniref:hypothetical protein n=1 Tax=Leptothermofonsia sp. ETS-13 TaxID=3035696 RepID=UPI003BA11BB5